LTALRNTSIGFISPALDWCMKGRGAGHVL
jgi:hypothetical protein